jgi:hypothetical protein
MNPLNTIKKNGVLADLNNQKQDNNILTKQPTRIFKYLGNPKKQITECPNCAEKGFNVYEYLNTLTKQKIFSCWTCIDPRTIKEKPSNTVIQLGEGETPHERLFQYVGFAPIQIKECPHCQEKGLCVYEYRNAITGGRVYACYLCIELLPTLPGLTNKAKSYPIKDFLLSRSWLVDYHERQASGEKLTTPQLYKVDRIYAKRDRAMRLICFHLESYYNAVIRGKYHFDSPTEDSGAIRR